MQLTSTSFDNNGPIPERCAFGIPDAAEHMQLGRNLNPQLGWSGVPPQARSLVLLCVDPDVPASAEDVNREDRTIPRDCPRTDFFHWVLVDIPPDVSAIAEGACSENVIPGGKDDPDGPRGSRQGINDYTGFLAGNADMAGDYFGYDGPCPPWNDERLHHYHFVLYATDLDSIPVSGRFTGQDVRRAMAGHVLAEASLVGEYSLNPELA